jgi:hypothetical protein
MHGNTVSLNPVLTDLDSKYAVRVVFERLVDTQSRAAALRANLVAAYEMIAGFLKGQEIAFMLRNRWGLSKKDAQKLYFDLRNQGGESGEGNDNDQKQPNRPETVEDKISMIMDYMKETSAKLDSIDRDIVQLKKRVEEILQRI